MCSRTFFSLVEQKMFLSFILPPQDPKQRSIMEMFQRSFTGGDDDMDEAALLEAANDWDDDCDVPGNSSSARHQSSVSPASKSIKDYFSR